MRAPGSFASAFDLACLPPADAVATAAAGSSCAPLRRCLARRTLLARSCSSTARRRRLLAAARRSSSSRLRLGSKREKCTCGCPPLPAGGDTVRGRLATRVVESGWTTLIGRCLACDCGRVGAAGWEDPVSVAPKWLLLRLGWQAQRVSRAVCAGACAACGARRVLASPATALTEKADGTAAQDAPFDTCHSAAATSQALIPSPSA